MVQVLQADCAQIERLVTAAVQDLTGAASRGGASAGTPLDKCQLMEAMHENHLGVLLPRVDACEAAFTVLCQRCIDDKVCAVLSWLGGFITGRRLPPMRIVMWGPEGLHRASLPSHGSTFG